MKLDTTRRASVFDSLRRVPLFRNCGDGYLEKLVADFSVKTYPKDTRIIEQLDDSTEMYVILDGRVQVTFWSEEGEEFILTDLIAGDFFGEMSLIDGNPRSANVVATSDTTLAMLSRDRFIDTIRKEPMVSFDLLMFLVQRLRQANEMLECFAFLDVRERLERLFAGYMESEGVRDASGYIRIHKITHKELAARTGSSREAVTKVMKVLDVKNLVKGFDGYFLVSPGLGNGAGPSPGRDSGSPGCIARFC